MKRTNIQLLYQRYTLISQIIMVQHLEKSLKNYRILKEKGFFHYNQIAKKKVTKKRARTAKGRYKALTYEITTKEAELYFIQKFSKIPDEFDLSNRKTLASLVISIINHKNPIHKIKFQESNGKHQKIEKTWGFVGRLEQMGIK